MKRKRGVVVALTLLFSLVLFQAVTADQSMGREAIVAANSWLALVDAGQYSNSWDNAASYFRAAVQKGQWKTTIAAVRRPLGKVLSRRLTSKQYATSLPGAPDGEYVVIQFMTSFQNKKSAIETVTPMRDKDGKWRVSGYYIK